MIGREIIHYRVPWRAAGSYPGAHPSQQLGSGLRFRNHVQFVDAPDARRFDARASLRDPFGRLQVRVYEQTSSIPVVVVADLSASMRYRGAHAKRDVVAEFIEVMSYSAYRTGDAFGFIGCGDAHTRPIVLPPTLNRAAGSSLAGAIRELPFDAADARGLARSPDFLGSRRSLVFLLSDFHLPDDELERLLALLAYHEVVPIVIWDTHEFDELPATGFARIVDPETGASRLLFMRPGLKDRIRERFAARRHALETRFLNYGSTAVFLEHGFDADDVSRHFLR